MTISWRKLIPTCLAIFLAQPISALASISQTSFTSAEHVDIGNNVKLRFAANDPGRAGEPILLPNGLNVTYGQIVTIGDFYEIPDKPVSMGATEAERKDRFLAAFGSFAVNTATPPEATRILEVISNEQKLLDEGLRKGDSPESVYAKIGHDNDIKFNCITGGGCSSTTWWVEPGRYLTLANMDYDHFNDDAWITYKTGHQTALEEAVVAHETNDLQRLKLAYALNAFATHFLTDRFSAGHIRTPRKELTEHTTPGTIGSLLSSYMHGEENSFGLRVHNLRGDQWIAYGDKSYYKAQTARHRDIIAEAAQDSADQIFAAFTQGTTEVADNVPNLIPIADETGPNANLDISPLFYWDAESQQLFRRTDTTNEFDRHWTTSWWGWSTLVELKRERGLDDEAQAVLARSPLREQALRDGLITNKAIKAYIQNSKK